jgi:putative sulfotransferase
MSEPERCVILSSGRCGSTLLSNLIAADPDTLSIQESLVDPGGRLWYSDKQLTGFRYWSLLSTPSPQWEVTLRIDAIPAGIRYPAAGRWAGNLAALPPISAVTLPAISDDPDSLFDLLDARVPEFPAQTLPQHHCMLLDLLASLKRRCRWVERSGGSSYLAGALLSGIPFDKVVYLTRNPADTALSMSRHTAFRLAALRVELTSRYGFDPYDDEHLLPGGQASDRQVPEEMRHLLPERLTSQALTEWGEKVGQHKLLCAYMMVEAEKAFIEHPPRHLLRISYEDLLEAPEEQLVRLGDFLGFGDPAGWAALAARQVRRR